MEVECLSDKYLKEYASSFCPSQRDKEISDLLQKFMSLDDRSRREALKDFSIQSCYDPLTIYSYRMADLALSTGNPKFIVLGLVALGLQPGQRPWGIQTTYVCLHYDAAKRLRVNIPVTFEKAARIVPYEPGNDIRGFLGRGDTDIINWNWYVSTRGASHRYRQFMDVGKRRKWPEDEQPK